MDCRDTDLHIARTTKKNNYLPICSCLLQMSLALHRAILGSTEVAGWCLFINFPTTENMDNKAIPEKTQYKVSTKIHFYAVCTVCLKV